MWSFERKSEIHLEKFFFKNGFNNFFLHNYCIVINIDTIVCLNILTCSRLFCFSPVEKIQYASIKRTCIRSLISIFWFTDDSYRRITKLLVEFIQANAINPFFNFGVHSLAKKNLCKTDTNIKLPLHLDSNKWISCFWYIACPSYLHTHESWHIWHLLSWWGRWFSMTVLTKLFETVINTTSICWIFFKC